MTNKSKQKGTAWETAVVRWLGQWFPHVERRTLTGSADKGDIAGIVGVVIECKNAAAIDLAKWSRELDAEIHNANADLGFLIIKRRGTISPGDAYVLTTAASMVKILTERNGGNNE